MSHSRIWICALLCLSLVGCSSKTTTGPHATVSGRVVVRAYVVDENGTVTDSIDYASASGIKVRLMADSVALDSANTVNGAFSFTHWTAGSRIAVGCVHGFPIDSTGPVVLGSASATFPQPLVLGTYGPIVVYPNPTNAISSIHLVMDSTRTAGLFVTTLAGEVVRVLASREFLAGVHAVLWDGLDDAGTAVPAGTYWVVFDRRSAAVPAARATSPAGVADVPTPGPLPFTPPVSCTVIVKQ